MAEDNINHPKHYETDKVECIEAMEITQGRAAVMSFCLCNAFKYLWRHQRKNGVEDIKKARWYLDKYIELAEKERVPVCKELKEESIKPIWTDQMTKSELPPTPPTFTMEESIIKSFARNSKDIADAIRKDDVLSDAAKEELLKNLSDQDLERLFNSDYGNGRNV